MIETHSARKSAPLLIALLVFLSLPVPSYSEEGSESGTLDEPPAFIEKAPLILAAGEQRLLRVPGLKRFSIGAPVIGAHPLPPLILRDRNTVILKGLSPGVSDLWIWKTDGQAEHRKVRVDKNSMPEIKPGLERALSQLEEVEILFAGAEVMLQGEIGSTREAARVRTIAETYPKEVHDETSLSPEFLDSAQKRLAGYIASSPYRQKIRIECRNGELIALGSVERAHDQQSLAKKLRSIFPLVKLEISALPDEDPTVHFKVFLLELKKSRFRNLGLSWPVTAPGAFHVTTSGIEDMLSLDVALEALESEGSARILSNPELVVRAPGEAELFSGGELPIHSQTHYYSNVTWKNFGLTLKLKVTHVAGERIRLEVFTEVSHLDPSISGDKVPGLQSNRMKTQVDARFDEPILLSGLLQQNLRQTAKGVPWLRQIPVLGSLFGSEDYLNEKSELVAILLPRATPPNPPTGKFGRLFDWQPQPEPIEERER